MRSRNDLYYPVSRVSFDLNKMLIFPILKVYDIDVENLPMFVYQLPPGTTDVLLTNRVIFTITHQEQSDEVKKFYID